MDKNISFDPDIENLTDYRYQFIFVRILIIMGYSDPKGEISLTIK